MYCKNKTSAWCRYKLWKKLRFWRSCMISFLEANSLKEKTANMMLEAYFYTAFHGTTWKGVGYFWFRENRDSNNMAGHEIVDSFFPWNSTFAPYKSIMTHWKEPAYLILKSSTYIGDESTWSTSAIRSTALTGYFHRVTAIIKATFNHFNRYNRILQYHIYYHPNSESSRFARLPSAHLHPTTSPGWSRSTSGSVPSKAPSKLTTSMMEFDGCFQRMA